jgi:hypothetical protein
MWQNAASLKVKDKVHIIASEFKGHSVCHFTLHIPNTSAIDKSVQEVGPLSTTFH